MSTVGKLDPMVRQRRMMRAALLRTHRARNYGDVCVLAELALISANPRLSGDVKQSLFERGAKQLAEAK